MTKPVFPVALQLVGRACLVVGSGREVAIRTRALLEARARPIVVCSAPNDDIRALARSAQIELHERELADTDLDGKWLAVLVDETRRWPRAWRVWPRPRACSSAPKSTNSEHNSYAHMAQARAGLLTIAISTAGQAPALGRRLREELERLLIGSKMADFVEKLATLRSQTPSADRRRVLGSAVSGVRFTGELELEP